MTVQAPEISDFFLRYEQIIFADVETTGLSAESDQIIELAAIRYYQNGSV